MKSLANFFIINDKFTIVLSLFVAIGGLLGLSHLNSESYPAVNFATAVITTQYSGASSRDVETLITKPIEDEIRSVKGLKDVRSVSKPGTSEIIVRVDMDNEDVKEVMDEVKKAVDRVTDLPMDLQELPSFLEVKSEEFPALELALVGDNTDRARDLMAEKIQDDLEDNKRVLNVRLVGHRPREFKIYLKQAEMDKHHISIDEVIHKVRSRNQDIPGGKLKTDTFEKLIRLEAKIASKKDIEDILIRSNLGGPKIERS
jgi:multidrug efflux pump subunit AcrB